MTMTYFQDKILTLGVWNWREPHKTVW